MRGKKYRNRQYALSVIAIFFFFIACNPYPGYEEIENNFFIKLNQFGDCQPLFKDAAYTVLDVSLQRADAGDSLFSAVLYLGKLRKKTTASDTSDALSERLYRQAEKLHCGDQVTWILPFDEIRGTFFSGYGRYHVGEGKTPVRLTIRVVHTFDRQGFVSFLMQAAQQGELSEVEALRMVFVDHEEHPVERYGDVFIERMNIEVGDTLAAGDEVTMNYTTYLLDGTSLDSLSSMTFQFGRPGQLVPGFLYGISFLTAGERARIYMPSYLAFGEGGNSTGLVPPHTPVYFDVNIVKINR